ncbi:nesprin-2-like [Callorhinchus milii]|uniref:nesprin-2-like n=1 Tax=Callorhinchus milii TaxID=7868 RepID=UPI001C3FB248|nr:nesprin-2-like [Callorhinchus milii]
MSLTHSRAKGMSLTCPEARKLLNRWARLEEAVLAVRGRRREQLREVQDYLRKQPSVQQPALEPTQLLGEEAGAIGESVRGEPPEQELDSVGEWLRDTRAELQAPAWEDPGDQLKHQEELQAGVGRQWEVLDAMRARVHSSVSEPLAPELEISIEGTASELETVQEECKLQGLRSRRCQGLSNSISAVGIGLRAVEMVLQQRSQSLSQAQAQHKRVWAEVEQWQAMLSRLDAEVQDMAEQDPQAAQQLMDRLIHPLQLHQRVARQAEQRTSLLNKIPGYLEQYEQVTNCAKSWIKKHRDPPSALQRCRQGEAMLHDVGVKLREVSEIYESEGFEAAASSQREELAALQQRLSLTLPSLEHVAMEIEAVEAEVKIIEKKISKVRAILSATDLFDTPVSEHLLNTQIILENVEEMRQIVEEMEQCRASLGLPQHIISTIAVFVQVRDISGDLEALQEVTAQQSRVLEVFTVSKFTRV